MRHLSKPLMIWEISNLQTKSSARFIISQCKKENSFKEGAIDKLITSIPILLDLEKNETALLSRFNPDLVEQTLLLTNTWQKTAISGGSISLEYMYATNAPEIQVNDVFTHKVEQLVDVTKDCLASSNCSFKFFSSQELLELYQKQKSNRLSLEFKDRPLSTEYGSYGIGYIGTVKLANYKSFLTSQSGEIRDDLFEINIRHFQGSVDVNKKIKHTIESSSSEDFWWLNNGITIIAEDPKEVGKTLSIENIQIVNGLQTSYSIFNNHDASQDDNRSVLVKVIINSNKEMIDNIIASTNSQNPVSATLLRATEPIQRNIELFFLNEGYYYDRRKNYYKNQGKPSTKIFSIQFTAQAIETLMFDDPHTARSRPTSLLKTEKTYKNIFNPGRNFRGYLNCCLINKLTHSLWVKHSESAVKLKTSNFKLHLSWIVTKEVFRKLNVTFDEIANLDLGLINEDTFKESIRFLNVQIDEYLANTPDTNLINIAKSKDFTDYLIKQLSEKYSVIRDNTDN
jgi:AIPR protein